MFPSDELRTGAESEQGAGFRAEVFNRTVFEALLRDGTSTDNKWG